jgi:hypothetical protein
MPQSSKKENKNKNNTKIIILIQNQTIKQTKKKTACGLVSLLKFLTRIKKLIK